MNLQVSNVEKIGKGWNIVLRAEMDEEELSRLDLKALKEIEDLKVDLIVNELFFQSYMETTEPWEDEPLEELLKALNLEVEYKVN